MNIKPDVIRNCLWLACLMGLLITGILSLNCDLLHGHLLRVTRQNRKLLGNMSKPFPMECLRENKAFELPLKVFSYSWPLKRDIKEALYEMSMMTFNIFTQPTFQSPGEEKHLEQIQIGLDQQLQYLEQCLKEEEKENKDKEEREEDKSKLELRRYFHRIGKFLKDKKYSHCAWKIVQVEIRRCLYYFQKLIELLRRK